MLITRIHALTGQAVSKDIDVTPQQLRLWNAGELIQIVMPHLSADDREFLITGLSAEEWDRVHPNEEKANTEIGEKWAFTFGFNTDYRSNFVSFTGSFHEARMKMVDYYGITWAFQYEWGEFQEQIEQYGLTELQPIKEEPGEEE